jgi:type VI secretion system protein ImpK
MSDKDNPFDRPADRTVFNPGARAVRPGVKPPSGPAPQPVAPPPRPQPQIPQPQIPQRAAYRQPAHPQPTMDASPGDDHWIETRDQQPIRPEPPPGPARALRIEELVVPHENPIMQAAGPILLLLGRLRVAVLQASPASLMEQVAAAIEFFEKEVRRAGVPADRASDAKYIVCAAADDIVQNIPTEDRHVWTQYSMLSRFFGDRTGGVTFFQKLDRAKMDPLLDYPLLELMHCCLALGFQGRYRTEPNGTATLQQIQRNLYELLCKVHPRAERELSPHWRGQELGRAVLRARVPFWTIAGVAALALLGLFLTLRSFLTDGAEIAAAEVRALNGTGEMRLVRPDIVKPPPAPPGPVCPSGLPEGVGCKVVGNALTFSVKSEVLFDSGQATLKAEFIPVAKGLAVFLDKEPGTIGVIGHTDNVKLRKTSPFASNWALSMERAKAVAEVLKPGLSDPRRIEVDGRADEAPVASNATSEGRARNRRVEIKLTRGTR